MNGHFYSLDFLEGFGDGYVLDDGNLDGHFNRIGLGHELEFCGDGGVLDRAVGLCVYMFRVPFHLQNIVKCQIPEPI